MTNKTAGFSNINFILVISLVLAVAFTMILIFNDSLKFDIYGVLYGILLSYANFLAGLKIEVNALKKEGRKFFVVVFGSLVVRLFVLLGLIIFGLLVFNFERFSFIFVFFSVYFFLLIAEIIFLLKVEKITKLEDKKS